MTGMPQIQRLKFELGRHETFALREGWLHKGLNRLVAPGGYRADIDTADALGLGSRMVKSLFFWLDASGLMDRQADRQRKDAPLATELGRAIYAGDRYFEMAATNWFIHLMLARRPGSVWNWFFNDFLATAFSRESCVDGFARAMREQALNQTTASTIQREVACLLSTYAAPPPNETADPEDYSASPLRGLSLVVRHHETGRYEKTHSLDPVPVEAFLACASMMAGDSGTMAVPLTHLLAYRNSPGRLFNMDGDRISEMAYSAAAAYSEEGVSLALLGSTRTLNVLAAPPETWLKRHFERVGGTR